MIVGDAGAAETPESAWRIAQQFVKNFLRAPGAASFGDQTAACVATLDASSVNGRPHGYFHATGWVDSPNSLGVTLRSWWLCRFWYFDYVNGRQWRCVWLQFDDQVVVEPPEPEAEPPEREKQLASYAEGLFVKIGAERRYPPMAVRGQQEGDVLVEIVVGVDGRLLAPPRLVRPCPHPLLNAEALDCVRRAAPFAPLPTSLGEREATFHVETVFHLR